MAIPDFQSAMLPILRMTADGEEHSIAEALELLADAFKTTGEERNQLLPSGRQTTLYSRAGWAKSYLLKGGLLEKTGRGRFRITPRGRDVLKGAPDRIDVEFLGQFSDFAIAHSGVGSRLPRAIPRA